MDALERIVVDRFGFPGFRPGQREIVQHVAAGGDGLVVMPTGAGKSLCYQIPALARGGTAIVVSPLIALMKDQVDRLVELGVRATFLNSSLTTGEYRARSEQVARGEIELLYVAPERFTPAFLEFLGRVDIRLFAIDEAHCLSQWGHDFRPDYLRLGRVRDALGRPPTLALTATATPEVQRDIVSTLQLEQGRVFIRGFDRENLILEVVQVGTPTEKEELLADLVAPGPALVYAATRKHVEKAAAALRRAGVRAGLYHAGLSAEERTRVQEDFMEGRLPVVVATNAFGMGIDKRDIRAIVHYDMPGTVEAYYQEIGRAGRDGRISRAVLLWHPIDRRIHEFFVDGAHPPAEWVHRLWGWLQTRASAEPAGRTGRVVFAAIEEMAEALPPDAGERAASACLYVLVREGFVRRIAPSDRAAWVQVVAAPRAPLTGHRQQVWASLQARMLEPGDATDVHPDPWAAELGLTRQQLLAAVDGLVDRGLIAFRAADRIGGVEIQEPVRALVLDEVAMKARRAREYRKLDRMEGYTGAPCRRRYVVEYFGEQAPFERCGTCDQCRMGSALSHEVVRALTPDEATVVLKVLSCIARMDRHANKTGWGIDLVAKVAVGSREEKVTRWGFQEISTYGVLAPAGGVAWTSGEVADVVTALVAAGVLDESYATRDVGGRQRTYKEVALTPLGWRVLKREETDVRMAFPHAQKLVRRRAATAPPPSASGVRTDLLASLRDLRRQLAERADVPAYVVCSNRTLEEMARARPASRKGMLDLPGMGPVRFERYGQPFLDAIRSFGG